MFPSHRRLAAACGFAFALCVPSAAQSLLHTDSALHGVDDVEITPDQRYAVVRENLNDGIPAFGTAARVYDLATGQLVANVPISTNPSGVCHDAVAVTNTRAVVITDQAVVLDLTNLSNPVLGTTSIGWTGRDVAITPDGSLAVVRGGTGVGAAQHVLDLASGASIASHASQATPWIPGNSYPYSVDVDSVAVTYSHAVMTGFVPAVGGGDPSTRVTIWELHPAGGGPPVVAFETAPCHGCGDQPGAPHDVAITPGGNFAVVRSELWLGVYNVNSSPPSVAWQTRLAGSPGPFLDEALDSLEVTDHRIVTISRISNPALGSGTQVDVFDLTGRHLYHRIGGSPHDLAITPNGARALVRTSAGVWMYDLANLPAGPEIPAISRAATPTGATSYFAGLDSIAVTDRFAVTLTRVSGANNTIAWFWDISGASLVSIAANPISGTRPLDVAITPDATKAVVGGTNGVFVFDLASGTQLFGHLAIGTTNWYPWCDGVAASDDKVVGIGYWDFDKGWIDVVDMTPFAVDYCVGAPNSTGLGAHAAAAGSASISSNDLVLLGANCPPNVTAAFSFGTAAVQLPFGDGFQCVGGTVHGLPRMPINASGAGSQYFDQAAFPGLITPGSRWRFQLEYRDPASTGAGFNASQGLTILFEP